jgi:hypothetical protein
MGRGVRDLPAFRWKRVFRGENTLQCLKFVSKCIVQDQEGIAVKELAKRPSVERSGSERCGPEPESFRVRDLVVELTVDPVLRNQGEGDAEVKDRVWKELVDNIRSLMAQSISVIVRGWTPALSLRFSKASIALQFGNLGQICQWVEGVLYAADDGGSETVTIHKTTTMEQFIDLVDDPTICGNFLDGKDTNSSAPMWSTPLLDSTVAWNQTMHLRFTQGAQKKDGGYPDLVFAQKGSTVIRSTTWTSQGWRLLTHAGYFTFPHHDCCGLCTYVVANAGAKIWAVMRPKSGICPKSLEGLFKALRSGTEFSLEDLYSKVDIVTVCLEEGDVM